MRNSKQIAVVYAFLGTALLCLGTASRANTEDDIELLKQISRLSQKNEKALTSWTGKASIVRSYEPSTGSSVTSLFLADFAMDRQQNGVRWQIYQSEDGDPEVQPDSSLQIASGIIKDDVLYQFGQIDLHTNSRPQLAIRPKPENYGGVTD